MDAKDVEDFKKGVQTGTVYSFDKKISSGYITVDFAPTAVPVPFSSSVDFEKDDRVSFVYDNDGATASNVQKI